MVADKKQKNTKEDLSWVLTAPVITEKAVSVGASNVYVFKVASDANKVQIAKAVEKYYGVKPTKVNVVNTKYKKVFKRRKNEGIKGGYRKAYVYLPKGKSIEF